MNLIKENWNKKDIIEFQEYLISLKNEEKIEWTTNLLKTKLPVLAIKTSYIKNIANEIYKGNYIEFLNYMLWNNYEISAINGFLITKINDFQIMKKYLDI